MKNNVYDDFVKGAEHGFKVVGDILPTLIGLMMATGILRASGALDFFSRAIAPITEQFFRHIFRHMKAPLSCMTLIPHVFFLL